MVGGEKMSYSEFPHTNYGDKDSMELIVLYKELLSKYEGTLYQIETLNKRLSDWEKSGDEKISQQINSVVTTLNNQISTSLESMDRKYDSAIRNLEAKTDEVLQNTRTEVIDMFNDYSHNSDSRIETKMSAIDVSLNIKITQLLDEVDDNLVKLNNELRTYIDDEIATLREAITNLEEKSGESGINFLWNNVYSQFGFSALDWYNFTTVTCATWNCIDMSCASWFILGKYITGFYHEKTKILNPITGCMDFPETILYQLIEQLNLCSLTTEEYDARCLTAEEYDNMLLQASKYDWRGVNDKRKN